MGFSEKSQVEGGFDQSDNRKWMIAGIGLRAPLKPIYTIPVVEKSPQDDVVDTEEEYSTTPKGEEARIPIIFTCPPAPKKRKPSSKFRSYRSGRREFFTPPDLETVFIRHLRT